MALTNWFGSFSLVIYSLNTTIQCLNYQGLVVELFKYYTVLSNGFSASRGLSQQDKNNNDWDTKKVSFSKVSW